MSRYRLWLPPCLSINQTVAAQNRKKERERRREEQSDRNKKRRGANDVRTNNKPSRCPNEDSLELFFLTDMSGNNRRQKQCQQIPLDLFLSGVLPPASNEKDQPVIVVDTSKKRSFLGRRVSDITYRSVSNSNSSFCSSVTSPSSSSAINDIPTPALGASRWESIPTRKKNLNPDARLEAPHREHSKELCPKRPTRTRTNDLKKNGVNVSPSPSKRALKRNSVLSPGRRLRALRNDSSCSRSFKTKVTASASFHEGTLTIPPRFSTQDMSNRSFS